MPAYKDESRGTWYASFYYTDWDGRRRLKKKRGFERKKDAQEFEREFLAKQTQSCDMTFKSLWELYSKDMKTRLRENTFKTKSHIVDKLILPFFGQLQISNITPAHVRKWQSGLIKKGYAQTYLKTINNQLSAIFNYAVKIYGLPKNPCRIAGSMGKKQADAMRIWTTDDYDKFIVCVRPADRVAFAILFWTGIRIGELLALTLNDFDFVSKTMRISKSYQRVNGHDIITEPKTEKSKREIPLPEKLCTMVQEYANRLYGYHPDDRLFPHQKSYYHKIMDRACEASGVERIRLHDLRHSHVSLLIELDSPVLLASERLGHEDIETTLRTYGHLYPDKHNEIAKRLNELMK